MNRNYRCSAVPAHVSQLSICRISTAALILAGFLSCLQLHAEELIIWDNQPASKWDMAYPVGNGRLGAMPQGMFPKEKILINEETIWARRNTFGMPEDSHKHLEEVRKLESAGDYSGADRYFEEHLEDGQGPCGYQLFGWLQLEYQGTAPVKQIHRELDLKSCPKRTVPCSI